MFWESWTCILVTSSILSMTGDSMLISAGIVPISDGAGFGWTERAHLVLGPVCAVSHVLTWLGHLNLHAWRMSSDASKKRFFLTRSVGSFNLFMNINPAPIVVTATVQ